MDTDTTLARAFAELRSTAPDADAELAALSTRLDGLDRRHPYRTATRGVAVAGVAAAVTLGAFALPSTRASHTKTMHSGSVATTSRPPLRQVAFSRRLATSTGADGIERPVVTVGAGWLPHGAVLTDVGAGRNAGDGGEKRWAVPYSDGSGDYATGVEVVDGDSLPEGCFLCATSRDLTIQGHPAREFEGDASFAENLVNVYVDLGNGQIADVLTFFESHGLSTADAAAVSEHIARDMTFDGHESVPVTAVLTEAPAGDTIVSADAGFGDDPGTVYRLNSVHDGAEIGIGGLAEKYPVTTGEPGRDVQGKPSVIIHDQDGRLGLYIKGLYGPYTKLYAGAGAETLHDLYVIADGIRPVH